jgi:hypothetical protein
MQGTTPRRVDIAAPEAPAAEPRGVECGSTQVVVLAVSEHSEWATSNEAVQFVDWNGLSPRPHKQDSRAHSFSSLHLDFK